MSRFLTTVSALCLPLIAAQGAAAQEQGLRYSGAVEAEFSSNGDADMSILGGDLDLGYSFGAFGVELGADSDYLLDFDTDFSAYFAAVTIDSALGQVALGAPRPVNDILLTLPQFAGSRLADLDLGRFHTRVATAFIKSDTGMAYGARLMGENGALRYGASIHQPTEGNNFTIVQGAVQYATGAFKFEGALEQAFFPDSQDGLSATVGAVYEGAPLSGGIFVSHEGIFSEGESVRGFLGYAVSDRLTVQGDVEWLAAFDNASVYGAQATYGFGNGAYAQFGVLDGTYLDNVLLDATVGFAF